MDLLRSSRFSLENDSVGPHLGGARWLLYLTNDRFGGLCAQTLTCTGRSLQSEITEQRRAEVAFTEAAHDRDDPFAFHLGPCGDLSRGPHVRSAADPSHDAFFFGKFSSPLERVFVVDLDHVVDERRIKILRNEAGTNALNPMLPRVTATDHGRMLRFDGDRFEIGIHAFSRNG